ncbi:class I SAM-dependent methyltransferase [Desulfolithobacter sp.]
MTWKNTTPSHYLAGVIPVSDTVALRAAELAARLHVPLLDRAPPTSLVLRVDADHLELVHQMKKKSLAVRVEFVQGAAGYRRQRGGREMLLRAVGARKGERPDILDGTGGLGRDSFVLAQAGCRVQLYERHPVLTVLLEDGLRRAAACPDTAAAAARITLHGQDVLDRLRESGDDRRQSLPVIYLDPMYPRPGKAAKAKKELQLLQLLVGRNPDDEQEEEVLLEAALKAAGNRVVVKRPRKGAFLAGRHPSYSLEGKSTRFDIYLTAP